MSTDIEKLIGSFAPDITKDQFSRLCYEIFIVNDKGKMLMAHLYNQHVYMPFTNIREAEPEIDQNKILAKAIKKDFIQSLLLRGQSYEQALKQKGGTNND